MLTMTGILLSNGNAINAVDIHQLYQVDNRWATSHMVVTADNPYGTYGLTEEEYEHLRWLMLKRRKEAGG